jgi:hypothetical protein
MQKYDITALASFALILSVTPIMMFSSPPTKIAQLASGQPEDPFPITGNETLTPAQRAARLVGRSEE